MWEWRIFYNSPHVQFLNNKIESAFALTPIETRTDDYLDIGNFNFGLKERGAGESESQEKNRSILELKIRLDRTTWAAELWVKTIRIPLPKPLKDNPTIGIRFIGDIIENDYQTVNQYYLPEHERFLHTLKVLAHSTLTSKKSGGKSDVYLTTRIVSGNTLNNQTFI